MFIADVTLIMALLRSDVRDRPHFAPNGAIPVSGCLCL